MLTDLPFCLQKMRSSLYLSIFAFIGHVRVQHDNAKYNCIILFSGKKCHSSSHKKTEKTPWHNLSYNLNLKDLKSKSPQRCSCCCLSPCISNSRTESMWRGSYQATSPGTMCLQYRMKVDQGALFKQLPLLCGGLIIPMLLICSLRLCMPHRCKVLKLSQSTCQGVEGNHFSVGGNFFICSPMVPFSSSCYFSQLIYPQQGAIRFIKKHP